MLIGNILTKMGSAHSLPLPAPPIRSPKNQTHRTSLKKGMSLYLSSKECTLNKIIVRLDQGSKNSCGKRQYRMQAVLSVLNIKKIVGPIVFSIESEPQWTIVRK